MQIRVGCRFEYETAPGTPMLMLVRPRFEGDQWAVHETWSQDPPGRLTTYVDSFGNSCWRFAAPGGRLQIEYDAVVETPDEPDPVHPERPLTPVEQLPDDVLVFTLPSRYVESDLLVGDAWQRFGATNPTWERVQVVCDWVYENVEYRTGSSGPATTAFQVYESRVGVCRDFAHLSVALCRALNIPARYAFGYLPDIGIEPPDTPMDFHAWFEAFVDGAWYTFDARHNQPRIGRILVGRGRDAIDVALSTSFGPAQLLAMTVWADEAAAVSPESRGDSPATARAA